MTHEKEDIVFKTLSFYMGESQKLHIKIISGIDKGLWRNGFIIDVNEDRLIFADDILGSVTYSLSEISKDIKPYKERR